MSGKYLTLMAILLLSAVLSCKKDRLVAADCIALKTGVISSNVGEVNRVITKFINSLPSQDYTEENINKLVSVIGEQCSTSVTMLCFDCVKTLPSQTEIKIGYAGTSNAVNRIIDITYTESNKMKFSNLHD